MRHVAVILNRNAQRATPSRIAELQELVPREDLFVTGTPAEGRQAMKAIAGGPHQAVCIGGGDGTFVQALDDLAALGSLGRLPLFALRLGVGNAIADVCGASGGGPAAIARDIERVRRAPAPTALELLEVNGRITYFAGMGIDALFIEDYHALIKAQWRRLGRLVHGVPGIVAAVALRTLPRLLREPPLSLRITNLAGDAHPLDPEGFATATPIPKDAVLFEGSATICSAGTIPTYGRGFTMFPFADQLGGGAFHLRVASAGPAEIVSHLPGVFAGTYRNANQLWDFAASGVRIEVARPSPLQIGGDPCPPTKSLVIGMHPTSAQIFRLR
jgi:diacylglycerol kinase family enzyme